MRLLRTDFSFVHIWLVFPRDTNDVNGDASGAYSHPGEGFERAGIERKDDQENTDAHECNREKEMNLTTDKHMAIIR